jgi:hypothetical protein
MFLDSVGKMGLNNYKAYELRDKERASLEDMKEQIMEIHGFEDLDDICGRYRIDRSVLDEYELLFACYYNEGWEGDSNLFLRKDGKFFVVDASHCSCYGLEGRFDPVETTKEAMMLQANENRHGSRKDAFNQFLRKFFGKP